MPSASRREGPNAVSSASRSRISGNSSTCWLRRSVIATPTDCPPARNATVGLPSPPRHIRLRCAAHWPPTPTAAAPPRRPATGRQPWVRSWPSSRRSIASAWVRRAGPLHSRSSGSPVRPRRSAHRREPVDRLERAQEHCAGTGAVFASHDIEAVVHAVDKVDVGVADRAVHRCRSTRQAGAGMAGLVGRPAVGLGLDDATDRQAAVNLDERPVCRADRGRPRRSAGQRSVRSMGSSAATPSPRGFRSG